MVTGVTGIVTTWGARVRWLALTALVALGPASLGCSLLVGDETRVVVDGDAAATQTQTQQSGDGGAPTATSEASTPPDTSPPIPDAAPACNPVSATCLTQVGACSDKCNQDAQHCLDGCQKPGPGDDPSQCQKDCSAKQAQCTSDCVTHCVGCASAGPGADPCDPQSACTNALH